MDKMEHKIQDLLSGYLRSSRSSSDAVSGKHLDQDTIAAFTDGVLSDRESAPVISHLVDCSFCLHVSAEIIKLNDAFGEMSATMPITRNEPTSVSEVLNGLFAKIFGTSDGAVFAHNEDERSEDKKTEDNSPNEEK